LVVRKCKGQSEKIRKKKRVFTIEQILLNSASKTMSFRENKNSFAKKQRGTINQDPGRGNGRKHWNVALEVITRNRREANIHEGGCVAKTIG